MYCLAGTTLECPEVSALLSPNDSWIVPSLTSMFRLFFNYCYPPFHSFGFLDIRWPVCDQRPILFFLFYLLRLLIISSRYLISTTVYLVVFLWGGDVLKSSSVHITFWMDFVFNMATCEFLKMLLLSRRLELNSFISSAVPRPRNPVHGWLLLAFKIARRSDVQSWALATCFLVAREGGISSQATGPEQWPQFSWKHQVAWKL